MNHLKIESMSSTICDIKQYTKFITVNIIMCHTMAIVFVILLLLKHLNFLCKFELMLNSMLMEHLNTQKFDNLE